MVVLHATVQAMRDKVISNLAASLEKAANELKKEGLSDELPDAVQVATAVEQALQKQFSKPLPYVHTCSQTCHVLQFFPPSINVMD